MAERDRDEDTYGPRPTPARARAISDAVNAALVKSNAATNANPMERTLQDILMGIEAPGFFRGDDGKLRNRQGEVVTERRRPDVLPLDEFGNFVMPGYLDAALSFLPGLRGVGAAGAAARGAGAARPAPQLFLPPPRRNAMFPDEMLNPPAAAPNTVRPNVPFRPNQFEDDIGEIARQRIAASKRPPTPDVNTSSFDDLGRFEGEGGLTRDAIMAARRMFQERIAMSQERIAAEEAFRAQQLSIANSEGMTLRPSPGASRQAAEEAAYRAQIDAMMNEGGGGAISRTPPPGTAFTMGEGSSSGVYRPNFTVPEGSRFGLPALRGSTEPVPTGARASASEVSAPAAAGQADIDALIASLLRGDGPRPSLNRGPPIGASEPSAGGYGPPPGSPPAPTPGLPTIFSPGGAPASASAGGLDTAALLRRLGIGVGVGGAGAMAIDVARDMYGQPETLEEEIERFGKQNEMRRKQTTPSAQPTPLGSPAATAAPNVGTRESYGPSDATLRFGFLPGYEGERFSSVAPDVGTRDSYGKSDAEYRAEKNSVRAANSPARRPAASAPATPVSAEAASSLMGRLFGGPDYQSNSRVVVSRPEGASQKAVLNWADSDNASDFVRADRAMQELLKNKEEFVGKNNTDFGRMASGGSVNGSSSKASGGRDAAIYKALEIIHHMMVNR